MSSSGIGPEQDPLTQPFRVEEIERIRWEEKKRRDESLGPPGREKPGLSAFLLLVLDKVVGFLKQSIQRGIQSASFEPARETLLLFKAALETMKREDRSQDAHFLKRLSKLWQQSLEHSIELQSKSSWSKGLKALIRDIEDHPKEEEHTFGYYLDEFAGQTWLPFPYMELIQKLHHQHELDPPSSLLTRWTRMIEEILHSD